MADLQELAAYIASGKIDEGQRAIQAALAGGASTGDILTRGLIAAMEALGDTLENAASILKAGLAPVIAPVDLGDIAERVINGDLDKQVPDLIRAALDTGTPAEDILNQGLIAGMNVVGAKFKANEFYVPEVLIAARAMRRGMDVLAPKLEEAGVEPIASVAIGTVKGDLHDIGKNLVGMMLKGAGFNVVDLGIDVAPEKFVAAVTEQNCKVIGLSALLTTTMPQMRNVISALQEAGVEARVIIGGAPVTQNYADEIGADGYAPDAASAADVTKELLARPAKPKPKKTEERRKVPAEVKPGKKATKRTAARKKTTTKKKATKKTKARRKKRTTKGTARARG